ncbi:DnaA/Hda family protein [Roseinatronobacter alkalisoli]|uniref:DnaA/Hda family protein n=1 Tax=Roseinatronobacter alkalisoli TaxID=3028235 RepID=A0ABT5TGX1_9RHOB|nr:DnaA/Hda family protein [Roseinatronobacter sp. HJB301]MDD7973173.1 DnaA/Hda family protein [Roseinatronobacter sp. HJB301]
MPSSRPPSPPPRAGQIHLPLALPASYGRSDFVPAPCNAHALQMITRGDWPAGKLVLTGPEGAGKTHLLHIWANHHGAALLRATALEGADLPALAARTCVALDDTHQIAGQPRLEAALFHLHNLLAAGGGQLLLAARAPVRDWGLCLPDLASRLQAAAHVGLAAPDDALLAAVLTKLFADRQVTVSDTLVPYLLARMERSLGGAQRIVALLDAEALARKKPISRQLAADILNALADRG